MQSIEVYMLKSSEVESENVLKLKTYKNKEWFKTKITLNKNHTKQICFKTKDILIETEIVLRWKSF